MTSLRFDENDRDEHGFIRVQPRRPEPAATAAPSVAPPPARPMAWQQVRPMGQTESGSMLPVVAGAVGIVLIGMLLFWVAGLRSAPTAPAAPDLASAAPTTAAPATAAPVVPTLDHAVIARWDYRRPEDVTSLAPGQPLMVTGQADGGAWLLIAVRPGVAVWVAAADVPGLAVPPGTPDLTVRPTPLPAPRPAAPAAPVVAAPPPASVCTEATVQQFGFRAGWDVWHDGLPIGTVERWSCDSVEDARQQALAVERQMIADYIERTRPTPQPRLENE